MTMREIREGFGVCGLVCGLCSYKTNCSGCRCKTDDCEVKACCREKGLDHCFECEGYPCGQGMHKGTRSRAFNLVAKAEGLDKLAEYLYTNCKRGIAYHRADGLTGDYDRCKTVEEVIDLLKNGKPDPYDACPTYETKHFLLRLVRPEDAADLLECYKNPTASVQANAETCTYGYGAQTIDEMRGFIRRWLDEYQNRCFIRFCVVDKQSKKAAGTVEIFGGGREGYSVLYMDVAACYETEQHLSELLKITDSFFHDIGLDKIVTRAVPEAVCRIHALTQNGYSPHSLSGEWNAHCYIKKGRV